MARIHINFIGSWRLFLGVREIETEVNNINEAMDFIDTTYGPVFEKKLQSMGVNKKESVWENSNILINGKKMSFSNKTTFKNGDRLDLIPLIAGG